MRGNDPLVVLGGSGMSSLMLPTVGWGEKDPMAAVAVFDDNVSGGEYIEALEHISESAIKKNEEWWKGKNMQIQKAF